MGYSKQDRPRRISQAPAVPGLVADTFGLSHPGFMFKYAHMFMFGVRKQIYRCHMYIRIILNVLPSGNIDEDCRALRDICKLNVHSFNY